MAVDIGDLATATPEELLADPGRLLAAGHRAVAARALAYAHATGARAYDEIGFRWSAALPVRDATPLQTLDATRLEHARELARREDPRVARARELQPRLRHRPLDMPLDGDFRFEHRMNVLELTRRWTDSEGREQQDLWTFPLSAPPSPLLRDAIAKDEPELAGASIRIEASGMRWLPLRTLLARGHFPRMQDCREELVATMESGAFYAFVSHRWLSRAEPDPDGGQARYAAWQLVAHLCDALRAAGRRGLHEPRRYNPLTGFAVGVAGSELAEALLVNVLRAALDDDGLREALAEIAPLERELADFGVARAAADTDLAGLRELLAPRPRLTALVDRIHVWYDYSCIPQAPREAADDALFVAGLKELAACQILGRTVILLDDAEDYLSRGWCTLEALTADTMSGRTDVLVGSERGTAREGHAEHYFGTLLQDRPHIAWRAILDTEVFGVQTPDECMRRLGLALSDPADQPLVYDRLRGVPAPRKLHTDASELWTGVVPLPVLGDGRVAVPRSGERAVRGHTREPAGTLDWTGALAIGGPPGDIPEPFLRLAQDGCHAALIGSCEGECVLLARWLLAHAGELPAPVATVSWLAVDIAPVGELPCGSLRAQPVAAPLWLIVGQGTALEHGAAGPALDRALAAAGVPYLELALDERRLTLVHPAPAEKDVEAVAVPPEGFPVHEGGLLRQWALGALV